MKFKNVAVVFIGTDKYLKFLLVGMSLVKRS